jgi:Holliday junction DNA helicase RuvB
MTEEHMFEPSPLGPEEIGMERSLRPACLGEFIGQRQVVENLQIAIEAAKVRGEVLDHVLFSGLPGLGKTTLSVLLASEMAVDLHATSGPALQKGKDVVGLLTHLKRGDVLFIDEIHRLSRETEEYLYSAMEDFKVDVVIDKGPDARSYRLSLEPFTLVGATTREGFLAAPFRSRFGIVEKLELYPPADLTEIIRRSAKLLGCAISEEASLFLAERCRGTPRYANRFLRRIRDVAQYRTGWSCAPGGGALTAFGGESAPLELTPGFVNEGLDRLGVDENGLDRVDRKILDVLLSNDEPVGVKTLAVSVGEEERTIEDVHEPYLIQKGMLLKTPRGRRPSSKAFSVYAKGGRFLF